MAKPVLRKPKKKVCQFCKEKVSYVDYKDTTLLRKFISDRGSTSATLRSRSRTPARSHSFPTRPRLAERRLN